MNKGFRSGSGEVVLFLNAGEMFLHPGVVSRIASRFEEASADTNFGDLVYVGPENLDRVTRYYRSDKFRPGRPESVLRLLEDSSFDSGPFVRDFDWRLPFAVEEGMAATEDLFRART